MNKKWDEFFRFEKEKKNKMNIECRGATFDRKVLTLSAKKISSTLFKIYGLDKFSLKSTTTRLDHFLETNFFFFGFWFWVLGLSFGAFISGVSS